VAGKINKKMERTFILDKNGKIKLGISLVLIILIFVTVLVGAFNVEEKYYLGDDLRVDLREKGNYTARFFTPSKTLLKKGSNDLFLYELNELGKYEIKFKFEQGSESYSFEVVEEEIKEDIVEIKEMRKGEMMVEEKNEKRFNEELDEVVPIGQIKIGESVKWNKKVNKNNSKNFKFNLPLEAERISIYDGGKEVNFEVQKPSFSRMRSVFSSGIEKEIIVKNNSDSLDVYYETPAPTKSEEKKEKGKKIIVSSPDDLHYENVLVTTKIEENVPIGKRNLINLFWEEENKKLNFKSFDDDSDGFIDYIEWIVPHLSTQTFDVSINILNVQSYPYVGGNWTVKFETLGNSNLSIRSINGTNFGESYPADLKFLSLKCGENFVDYVWKNDSIFVEDYYCGEVGYETSLVLTEGKHYLEFQFGDVFGYAQNDAVNSTPQTCTDYWGFDCGTGPPESGGDNTFDSCSNGAGNDESVEEIYLNVTSVHPGDSIEVTCEYDPYRRNDDLFIWYHNGNSWIKLYEELDTGSGDIINRSVIFTANSNIGEHWVRCGLIYGTGSDSDECMDSGSSYYDNDDLKFEVVNFDYVPSPMINSSVGTDGVDQDLNCFDYLENGEGEDVNVSVIWYKEGVPTVSLDYNGSYSDGAFFNSVLGSGNTSVGDNWSCGMRAYYRSQFTDWTNSSTLTILEATTPPRIDIDLLWPTGNVNAYQNEFFKVSLNVSCFDTDCGDINVTLDPIQESFENFESGDGGFTHASVSGGADGWHRSSESSNDGSYSFKMGDPGTGNYPDDSNSYLQTPVYDMNENSTFSFYHYVDTETDYDGGKLEYMINESGNWNKVTSFVSGGYNGNINNWNGISGFTNNEAVWDGTIGSASSFSYVEVDLNSLGHGNVTFRWRFGSDTNTNSEGWYVDSVNFTSEFPGGNKGIIPVGSGTPFYTNKSSNPYTIFLNENQSEVVDFFVNAAGLIDTTYEFFAYANVTSNPIFRDITEKWNVTIVEYVAPVQLDLHSPSGTLNDPTPLLNLTLSGSQADSLWYNLNDSTNVSICDSCFGNFVHPLFVDGEGTFELNVYANNSNGDIQSESSVFSIDLNNNFYDSFDDNHSVLIYDSGVFWEEGSLNYSGSVLTNNFYDFELGDLGDDWEFYSSNAYSRIGIRDEDSYSGSHSVIADSYSNNEYELSELISTYDYSGTQNFILNFWFKEESDENDGGSDHSGHQNADAVYFTCDGNYWYHLYNLYGDATWQEVTLDIGSDPDFCSEVNESFAIKFTQYDNFGLTSDGIMWDDINITYDGAGSSIAESRTITTEDIIAEISNISWAYSGSNGEVKLQVSANNGTNWHDALNNQELVSLTAGNDLKYKVLFEGSGYVDVSIFDLNISWSNTASPPPTITINSPSSGTFPDVTPVLNISLDSMANNLWYAINGGSDINLCSSCSGEQTKTLYLEEGSYTLTVYADNSIGTTNSETISFTVDMNGNYYDSFLDDSQIWSFNGPKWRRGNVSYQDAGIGLVVNESFDNMNSWTPTGGSWGIVNGEMVCSSNEGDPGVFSVYDDFEMKSGKGYNISFTSYDDDNDENALVFRYKDATNHYKCAFELQDLASSEHGLIKFDGGVMTVLDTDASKTYTQDAYNNYAVTVENNNITCYLNGEAVFSAFDSTWEEGKVGVFSDFHQSVRYDNFTVSSWITDVVSFVSYPITLTSNIVEILNISWNSYLNNSNNSISIQVSPNDGMNWYDAVNGQGLGSTVLGKDLIYKVIFYPVDDNLFSLLDLNITWTHTSSPPPIINITDPGAIVKDTTPIIETSLNGPAEFYWYTINDGPKNLICEYCTGTQDVLVLLEEGDYEIDFYANNSVGTESTNSISFEVDLERNYFDEFLDSSQIAMNDSVIFNPGNLTYVGNGNLGIYDGFERTSFEEDWATYSSLASGVVEISNYDSYSGSKSVAFYTNAAGTNTLNELITDTDFTGAKSINLNFWYLEEVDENTAGADHIGHYNGDAVYFTCDGSYWYHLMDFTGTTGWQEVDINISNDPDYCNEINSNFAIKFAQYDNWDLASDGILVDDVNISVPGGRASLRSHPINVSQNIRRIANISWEEIGTDSKNRIHVNLSVDGGNNWFSASNGESITGFNEGSSLVYDVLFDLEDFVEVSLLNLNITWEEPPSVRIEYPENNYVYNFPINKMNYTVAVSGSETLDTCWYTDDEGLTNYTVACEEEIPMNSTDGVNKWRLYANDSSGAVGSDYVQFILDTSAPSIVFINQSSSPVDEGSDFNVNVNITDSNTDSVWIVIWENIIGGVQKFSGFLNNVFGNLFSIDIPIDFTYNLTHNYTIYANDTTGLEANYNGSFDVLKSWFVPDFEPLYSDGSNPTYISGELKLSDGSNLINRPFNIWFENELIPIENLTGNGVYQDVFNFTGQNDIFNKSYSENVTYNGTFATLSGSNTSGLMAGIIDAGALVLWDSVNWELLTDSCSGTVDYVDGNNWGYSSTMDTYIDSANPTTNYGDSESLLLDTSPVVQRTLLKFDDIFGYGKNKIPYDSSISSAIMYFNVYDIGNAFNVYEILEDWEEDRATYNGRLSGISWSSIGVAGSASRSVTSLGTISAATIGTKSLSITDVVSSWNNHSKENYGFVMEPGGSSGVMLRSSEFSTLSERPNLTVSFSSSECAGIQVYVRTSKDKIIWNDWKEIFIGEKINDSLGMSRYLEYKIVFGSFDETIKPNLWDIKFNYTAISTDSNGRYNYSYITPSTFGTYDLNLTAGYRTISAEKYIELKVQSGIDPVVTLLNPDNDTWFNSTEIIFYYNATDLNHDLDSSILFIDGLNVSYNQTQIIEGTNQFNYSFLEGEYLWSVKVLDSGGLYDLSENRSIGIDLTNPSVNLNYPSHQSTFTVGYLNLSFIPEDNLAENLICNVTLDSINIYENEIYASGSLVNVSSGPLSGGLHYWNATCVDKAGRQITSDTWEFNISDTPPILNLVSPFEGYVSSVADVNFTFIPNDNSGINYCELLIDGNYETNITNPILNKNTTILATDLSEGFHNWTVRCSDLSSTTVIAPNRSIGIDLNSPTIEIFFPMDNYQTDNSTPIFNLRINDTIDSEISCNLNFTRNVSDSFNATNGQRFNFTSSILGDGVSSWFLNCSDDVGRFSSSSPRNINVSESPTVVLNMTNKTYISGNSFSVYYVPNDNDEINSCNIYMNDVLNQTSYSVNNGVQNFFDLDNLEDGIYDYYVSCEDGIGLEDVSETNRFIVDNIAPKIFPQFPLDEDVYSVNITFNFTAKDELSEDLNCSIFVDSEIKDSNIVFSNYTNVSNVVSEISDGTHDWYLTCYDLSGNFNNSEIYNFTRYTAPGVNLIYPENNSWMNVSDFQFIYYPMDDVGFQKTELYLNEILEMENGSFVNSHDNNSFNVSLLDGVYDWYVRVVDSTGMPALSENRRVYIDTENPVLNLGLPQQDEVYSNNSVGFNFTVSDNLDDSLSCELYVGSDLEWSGEVSNDSEKIVNLLLVDGNHSYKINCSDNSSNGVTSEKINFTVYAPPVIELVEPANESLVNKSTLNFSYVPYDALGVMECSIYLDEVLQDTSNSIVENILNNFTVSGISEGVHNWGIECMDNDLNVVMSNYSYFSMDLTSPLVVLNMPFDGDGIDFNSGQVIFRWKAVDALDNFPKCDLIIDGNIEVNDKLMTNNSFTTEIVSGLSFGEHYWNVSCWDGVNNLNYSETRMFNFSYPDFFVNDSNIVLNDSEIQEGESILINATIDNIGYANSENVLVQFYQGNPFSGGIQFGDNQTVDIGWNDSLVVSEIYFPEIGLNEIYVVVDFYDGFTEFDEENNFGNKNVSVGAWQFFYGDINQESKFALAGSGEIVTWNISSFDRGSIFVADSESIISWNDLTALGKNLIDGDTVDDFSNVDSLLSMIGFEDSISNLYLGEETNFSVFGKIINEVPITNSTNNSNFVTGILWDGGDDEGNYEFDVGDSEDLIFVTKLNENSQGAYGVYDYELRVPAKLREYAGEESEVVFYVELY
jgi:hypothetical protein